MLCPCCDNTEDTTRVDERPPMFDWEVYQCVRCHVRCDNYYCDFLRPDRDGTYGLKPWRRRGASIWRRLFG